MNATVFCESCGGAIPAEARFCKACGARQGAVADGGAAAAFEPAGLRSATEQAARHLESFTPGASELTARLLDWLRTPAATSASLAGASAAAGTFVVALVLAIALPDRSLLGVVDVGRGVLSGAFAQMLNFVQAGYGDGVGKLGPALFVALPIAACALAARAQADRTRALAPRARLLAGAGTGPVFGLLMLIPALAVGDVGAGAPDVAGAVLLGMVWGSIGGTFGAYRALASQPSADSLQGLFPATVADPLRTLLAALRPLAVALVAITAVATLAWTVETLTNASVREGRSTAIATVDQAAYAVEHGVRWTELGGLVEFNSSQAAGPDAAPLGYPVPLSDPWKVKVNSKGQYRIFALREAMPAYTFIPLVVFLIGTVLLMMLNAGFAVARTRVPRTPALGAAWGCLVGPSWAIAMVILNALLAKPFFGGSVGGSVFGSFLLGGLLVGAIGGALSVRSSDAPTLGSAVAGRSR